MLCQCDPPRKLTRRGRLGCRDELHTHTSTHDHTRFCTSHTAAERSTPQRTGQNSAQHSTAHCQQQSIGAQQRAQQEIPERAVTAAQEVLGHPNLGNHPGSAAILSILPNQPAELQTNQPEGWLSTGQLIRCWQCCTQAASHDAPWGRKKEPNRSKSTRAAAQACCSTPHTSHHPAGRLKERLCEAT